MVTGRSLPPPASPGYQAGTLGLYYLPATASTLLAAGSTTADLLGLADYTTQASQTPEGTARVDTGYHYVATDSNGNPLDTVGDGIPDYLADSNGDGVFDAGDLCNWLIFYYPIVTTNNGLIVFTVLQ